MISTENLKKLKELIDKNNNIAIIWHANPDWDCIGSCLGLWTILERLWKKIFYYTPKTISSSFEFVKWIEKIKNDFEFEDYDLAILCDLANPVSLTNWLWNENLEYFKQQNTLVIDHHVSNTWYWNFNILDFTQASCCEIILDIINNLRKEHLDKQVANYLMLGLITDTSCFQNSNVEISTFENAIQLIQLWADRQEIINNTLRANSYSWIKFHWLLIQRTLKLGNLIYTYFDTDEIVKLWLDREWVAWILEILKQIKEANTYLLLIKEDNMVKGSLRTRIWWAKANEICQIFWGWWHPNAWWFKIPLEKEFSQQMNDIIKKISEYVW